MYPSLCGTPTSIHPLSCNTAPADTAPIAPTLSKAQLLPSNCPELSTVLSNISVRGWRHAQGKLGVTGASPDQRSGPAGSAAAQRLQVYMGRYDDIAKQISALPPQQLPNKLGRHVQMSFELCGRQLKTVVACREKLDKLEANNASPEEIRDASSQLEAASHQALRSIKCLHGQLPVQRAVRCALLANRILMGLVIASLIVSIAFPPAAAVCGAVMFMAAGSTVGLSAGVMLTWMMSSRIHDQIASWATEARIGLPVTEDRLTRPQWLQRLLN